MRCAWGIPHLRVQRIEFVQRGLMFVNLREDALQLGVLVSQPLLQALWHLPNAAQVRQQSSLVAVDQCVLPQHD